MSGDWEDIFYPIKVSVLPRPGSNHTLLLLKGGGCLVGKGPRPFRFQNLWLLHPGFVELIEGWWEELEVRGPLGQRF